MARKGWIAETAGEIGKALTEEAKFALHDVRNKVVEEPWFGQATTPNPATFAEFIAEQHGTDIHGEGQGQDRNQAPVQEQGIDP